MPLFDSNLRFMVQEAMAKPKSTASCVDCSGVIYAKDRCSRHYHQRYRKKNKKIVQAATRKYRQSEKGQTTESKNRQRYYEENKEEILQKALHARLQTLGISVEEYMTLLKKQKGVCGICRKAPVKRRLAVDHCHQTGRVRGLLCGPCNTGLGLLGDNAKGVKMALSYLACS
jgi:predicted metal-dependent hydrolase